MATATASQDHTASIVDQESDYGSDLDDATLNDLASQAESQPTPTIVLESIEAPAITDDHGDSHPLARLARRPVYRPGAITQLDNAGRILAGQKTAREASIEIEYDESNRSNFSRE